MQAPPISTARGLDRIVTLNVPKGGTWLLGRCIELLTGRTTPLERFVREGVVHPNQQALWSVSPTTLRECLRLREDEYLVAHLPYTEDRRRMLEDERYRGVFILRDPRDRAVSAAYWIRSFPTVWPRLQSLSFDELLLGVIDPEEARLPLEDPADPAARDVEFGGVEAFSSGCAVRQVGRIDHVYRDYVPWMGVPWFVTVRFESLVGPAGGGTGAAQTAAVSAVARHIGIEISNAEAAAIAAGLFGQRATFIDTFRRGRAGAWREHFGPRHREAFKRVAGPLLVWLGYERDLDW